MQSQVEVMDHHEVGGWVEADAELPPPTIDILYRGAVLGSCVADLPVAGTDQVNPGRKTRRFPFFKQRTVTARRGFRFDLPTFFPQGEVDAIEVRLREPPHVLRPAVSTPKVTSSRFGGMWIDRADWKERLAAKRQAGEIDDEVADQIERLERDGYVVIERAVAEDEIDQLNADIDKVWRDPPPGAMIETFARGNGIEVIPPALEWRDGATKLLDLYAFSEAARKAIRAAKVMKLLSSVFEARPVAFQGLTFWNGSQQPIHKDTAYVKVDTAPLQILATWLALEDISPGTGELEYYVGSHRAPDYLFGGHHKWSENNPAQHEDFLDSLHREAADYGYPREKFLARKGDVLIWHADLAHGGATITQPGRTRRSLVTHFTGEDESPFYRRTSRTVPLQTETCSYLSGYTDVPAPGSS